MPKFMMKPIIVEAHQWFKNGDHPLDGVEMEVPDGKGGVYIREEGLVVRTHRTPSMSGTTVCKHCGKPMRDHGWIDEGAFGREVCPGDWIITGIDGDHYPCKPAVFEATYYAVQPD